MPAIDGEGAGPMHGGVGLAPHLSAFEILGINDRILGNHRPLLHGLEANLTHHCTKGGYRS